MSLANLNSLVVGTFSLFKFLYLNFLAFLLFGLLLFPGCGLMHDPPCIGV